MFLPELALGKKNVFSAIFSSAGAWTLTVEGTTTSKLRHKGFTQNSPRSKLLVAQCKSCLLG